jgi:hypothetical protein
MCVLAHMALLPLVESQQAAAERRDCRLLTEFHVCCQDKGPNGPAAAFTWRPAGGCNQEGLWWAALMTALNVCFVGRHASSEPAAGCRCLTASGLVP